jgi:hypothetical protein
MRTDFSSVRLPREVVAEHPPNLHGLFDHLRSRVTEDSLKKIAECDYEMNVPENLEALRKIRDGIGLDDPLEWIPNEVLELYRWTRFDGGSEEEHVARAFSCCALLLVPDVHENRRRFGADSLAPLVDSAEVLLGPYLDLLISFLTGSLEAMEPWDEDYLYHALGLVVVLQRTGDPLFRTVADWFVRAHDEILTWHVSDSSEQPRTFLDVRYLVTFPGRWRNLAAGLRERVGPNDPISVFLERLSQGKTVGQRLRDARDMVNVARIAGPSMIPLLWKLFRRKDIDN